MNLLDFPPELVERIFEAIVYSREFKRVMRLRVVNRMFKDFIDDAIFRLRLLHDPPETWLRLRSKWHSMRPREERLNSEWYSYVYRYLAYHAWREKDPRTIPGRIRRAAVIISEQAGDAGRSAIMARLQSLCRLAAHTDGDRGRRAHLLSWVRQSPWISKGSDEDLEDDLCVAAAYLGYRPFVEKAVSQGRIRYPIDWMSDWISESEEVSGGNSGDWMSEEVSSGIFGPIWDAAVLKGEVSMLRLLLSASLDYNPDGPIPTPLIHRTLRHAASSGHRDAYDFAFYSQSEPGETALEHYEIREL
ncbi:ankyrin repeat-containing domain protein [Apiospora phragmitis]|uniref:Ankyrin repeat-containing domain protein n=1 Tax=Apiospora phragmitis TaxID=2905665 RepID=A0ABR1UGL9_9PEZI